MPRKPQEAPGEPRRPQEAPRRPRTSQKASGGPRRLQEAPGMPRRPEEALGRPRRRKGRKGPTCFHTCSAQGRKGPTCFHACSVQGRKGPTWFHACSAQGRASSRFGTESDLELKLVERPARFDCGQLWASHGLRQLEFKIQISSARSRMQRTTWSTTQ